MDEKLEVRERILHAAMERIMHYGFAKTTMAEIAADCGMSAGNIYRFFESKADIAEAMARHHYAHEQGEMAALSRRREIAPDVRLREMFFTTMRNNYRKIDESAKILEVAEMLKKERPLFINEQLAQERVYIVELLEQGISIGTFRNIDAPYIAEMIQSALSKFSFPQLFSQLTLPKLERELNGVLDLILWGLYTPDAVQARVLPATANGTQSAFA
ncbi:MAG: TetR/AcrR family transcriptional regulator [Caulobacterales bacterium]|jgi:AcrR family transcriptional regulator